jgi:hypothetical protein
MMQILLGSGREQRVYDAITEGACGALANSPAPERGSRP